MPSPHKRVETYILMIIADDAVYFAYAFAISVCHSLYTILVWFGNQCEREEEEEV